MSLALALLLMFAIFGMADSSLATGTLSFDPPWDKLLHASFYGTIAGLMRISEAVRRVALLWLMLVGLAILDELHQMTIVGRQASQWLGSAGGYGGYYPGAMVGQRVDSAHSGEDGSAAVIKGQGMLLLIPIILTYNEEANISQTLDSIIGWADEVFRGFNTLPKSCN